MKERPILFSAPMVRALLAGTKTQTRRICKAAKLHDDGEDYRDSDGWPLYDASVDGCGDVRIASPYGVLGDRLWVRETCRGEELTSGLDGVRYLADDGFQPINDTPSAAIDWLKLHTYRGQKGATVPGIHMPRWASRIDLEVTGVRVERLQAISEADAKAEGAPDYEEGSDAPPPDGKHEWSFRAAYQRVWEQINGAGSWAANPWVWVVEFRRIS